MFGSKSDEEREFYIRLAVKERYSSRQLERQMDSGYYERYMLSKDKLLPESLMSQQNPFLDQYVIEFLDLPGTFHENDFRRALVKGMRDFILELGKDFTFVGEEYLNFILDQLSNFKGISYRAMMGEYIIYYNGKIVGGIYDNRFLVKPVKAAVAMLPDAKMELSYEGGRKMLLVEDVDNRELLQDLLQAIYEELPAVKKI